MHLRRPPFPIAAVFDGEGAETDDLCVIDPGAVTDDGERCGPIREQSVLTTPCWNGQSVVMQWAEAAQCFGLSCVAQEQCAQACRVHRLPEERILGADMCAIHRSCNTASRGDLWAEDIDVFLVRCHGYVSGKGNEVCFLPRLADNCFDQVEGPVE